MSGVLEKNLAALRGRFPELADLVAAAPPLALETLGTPSGQITARVPGLPWLHSTRSPTDEARRLVEARLSAGEDCALLLGFGLGYQTEACLRAGVDRVLVVEAEPGALAAALALRDLARSLADERLAFVAGGEPEAVVTALELSGARRAAVVSLNAARLRAPDWYDRAAGAAARWIAKSEVNEATLARFGKLWVRNLARNYARVAGSPGVEALQDRFAGLPSLVLAAGPSLDLVLPKVRELSRRAVVVCVDTALRSLVRAGLQPDFLVIVDPQYWNWRHVADLAAPGSFLVSESAVWPASLRRASRGVFFGGSLFPLGRALEAFSGAKGRLGAGGSVATSAWDLARLMGCASIWLAGLDLGYPSGATHARASLFEQRALARGERLAPAATSRAAALFGVEGRAAPSSRGGEVRTDRRMLLYAWWFESRFARPSSPPTYSLAPDGLAIPGLGLKRVEELLELPDRREEIDGALGELDALSVSAEGRRKGVEGLDSLVAELAVMEEAAEAGLLAATRARVALGSGGAALRAALAELDRCDAALLGRSAGQPSELRDLAKEVAGFLLPPAADLATRAARDLGESLSQSERIYRQVAESARYHREALDHALCD